MKRILSFLLAALCLLATVSCQSADPVSSSEPKTAESTTGNTTSAGTEPTKYTPQVTQEIRKTFAPGKAAAHPTVSWDDINAIPIATASMSVQQLRQLCVDFFRLTQTLRWTTTVDFRYTITSGNSNVSLKKEGVDHLPYGGLPYVTNGRGNLYVAMNYYDPATGILHIPETDQQDFASIIGNQCSFGAYWVWARVSNSVKFTLTDTMIPKNNAVPIGDYEVDPNIGNWSSSNKTKTVCKNNGEQKMYEAYAAFQIADGMVMNNGAGHVQMISAAPVVVRKANGTIDGDKSYILYLDQGSTWNTYTFADGSQARVQADVDVKMTFAEMYSLGYLPFSIPEFLGTDPVEPSRVTTSYQGGPISYAKLSAQRFSSNYPISYVTLSVLDPEGKVCYELMHVNSPGIKGMVFPDFYSPSAIAPYATAEGTNTVRVDIRIGTGENYTVVEGPLVA